MTDTQYVASSSIKSDEEIRKMNVRNMLNEYAGTNPDADAAVVRHGNPVTAVLSIHENTDPAKAIKVANKWLAAEQEEQDFILKFDCYPLDGAIAVNELLITMWGSVIPVVGRAATVPIPVSAYSTKQTQWGTIELPFVDGFATMEIGRSASYGPIFELRITCPKKYAETIDAFDKMLKQEIKDNSIYRNKAIKLNVSKARLDPIEAAPQFIRLNVDSSIVYNQKTITQLDDAVWAPLRHTELMRQHPKLAVTRKVLLFGPFGTGKSECGRITAEKAIDSGWTYVQLDVNSATLDDLDQVLQTARLLAPAVVFIEDVEKFIDISDEQAISRLLDMFDNKSTKDRELITVMTTNHPEKFHPGMLRPGRIDAQVEISKLDKAGTIRMVGKVIGENAATDLDYEAIAKQFDEVTVSTREPEYAVSFNPEVVAEALMGREPAFQRKTLDKSLERGLIRNADRLVAEQGSYSNQEASDFEITTQDVLEAHEIMNPHHDMFLKAYEALEGVKPSPLAGFFEEMAKHVEFTTVTGDTRYPLVVKNP